MRRLLFPLGLAALTFVLHGCGNDEPAPPAPTGPSRFVSSPVDPPIVPENPQAEEAPDPYRPLIDAFELGPLPATPYPTGNRYNPDRIRLGRLLFWDPILGGESAPWVKTAAGKDPYRYRAGDVACATCHQPEFGFADGRPLGAGVGGGRETEHTVGPDRTVPGLSLVTGEPVGAEPRNSMTILNAALNGRGTIQSVTRSFQFMDGLVTEGLESQAFVPLGSREEMAGDAYGRPVLGSSLTGVAIMDSLRKRVVAIPEYVELFKLAFAGRVNSPSDIRADQILLALSAFERELVTPGSRYDRFVTGGYDIFSSREKAGFLLFFGKGLCGDCHRGPMLSDYTFRCQGVGDAYNRVLPGFKGKNGQGGDWGLFHGSKDIPRFNDGKFYFRVMTIRNIELTAPYFHSGSARTLREVLDFYNRGGLGPEDISTGTLTAAGAIRDASIRPLGLSDGEIDAIIAFMKTTTSRVRPGPDGEDLTRPPERVPSGLVPPGVPTPEGIGPF